MNQADLEREAQDWQRVHVLTSLMRIRPLTSREQDELHQSLASIRAIVAALRKPQQEAKNAEPNDDGGIEFVRKHGLFIYEVDFGDEGKGRYVRLRDFNRVAALVPKQELETTKHPDDVAVDLFATAMKAKLEFARNQRGRGGWQNKGECSAEFLSGLLRGHVEKGDPTDVANFCCFLWNRGEGIAQQEAPGAADHGEWYTDEGGVHHFDLDDDLNRLFSIMFLPDGRVVFAANAEGKRIHGSATGSEFREALAALSSPTIGQQAVDDAMVQRVIRDEVFRHFREHRSLMGSKSYECITGPTTIALSVAAALTAALAADGGKSA